MAGIILLALFFFLLLLYLHHSFFLSKYWSERNVPHPKPVFLLGNLWKANFVENVAIALKKIYDSNRDEKMIGFWVYFNPSLLILDLNLVRRIFIRDFDHFTNRMATSDPKFEPLTDNLFNAMGKEWRDLRMRLRPAFTPTKMKMMFPTMVKCGHQLRDYLRKPSTDRAEVPVKDLMARFTTDVIGSCGFGIEMNSIKNPDSEFRKHGRSIFETHWRNLIVGFVGHLHPKLRTRLRVRRIAKDTSDFFLDAVKDTMAYRRENNTTRNDFLQLIMQLMDQGSIEEGDKNPESEERMFTDAYAAAQCFVFFTAGFETSSTALTFGLYELALHPDIQAKLHKEIDDAFSEGEITYESVSEMQYLDKVVHEILRKHPPGAFVVRKCTKNYHIPELNFIVEKGTDIYVSVLGIHHDPKYYTNPETFDPERFSPEEKGKRDAMAFLPFGEGPRNCIGSIFGLMQIKIGLLSVLRYNTVEVCSNTPVPFKIKKTGIIFSPVGEMPLVFKKRL